MRCNYKARHTELSDDIKEYCAKKFEKFEKMLPEDAFLEVEFIDEFGKQGGLDKLVQIDLAIPGEKHTIHLENATEKWRSSVDIIQGRLEIELNRLREKKRDSTRYPKKYKTAENEEHFSEEL